MRSSARENSTSQQALGKTAAGNDSNDDAAGHGSTVSRKTTRHNFQQSLVELSQVPAPNPGRRSSRLAAPRENVHAVDDRLSPTPTNQCKSKANAVESDPVE